nr:helix-turn-helix domain-containing protein [uncultured Gellertiella sp.]
MLPVPFIISLILVVVLVRFSFSAEKRIGVLPRVVLLVLAVQSVLIGLRWGYHLKIVWPVQSVLAAMIPSLMWLALNSMVSGTNWKMTPLSWFQIVAPPVLILLAPLANSEGVDVLISALFVGYGMALLYTTFKDDIEWLDRIPFQSMVSTNTVFRSAGLVLISSALVDLVIVYDMAANAGNYSAEIVGISSLLMIIILSASIALIDRLTYEAAEPCETDSADTKPPAGLPEMDGRSAAEMQALFSETLTRLDALMISKRVYRDPNLSLDRLARKLVVPARQISAAINSQRAMNVPQYVNMFRVMEACELLSNNSAQITEVIFDAGFQTKSNFNREFQRIVGMSPSEWRRSRTADAMPKAMESFLSELRSNQDIVQQDAGALFPKTLNQVMHH